MKKKFIIVLLFFFVGILSKSCYIEASKTEKMEIQVDYIDENSENYHMIYWGSEIALYAKKNVDSLHKEDEIQWKITSKNNRPLQIYKKEYKTDSGQNAILIYAPYGYCDDIQIQAISEKNNIQSNIYKLNISDGTKWNGKNYFNFHANKPENTIIEGNEPIIKEKWDSISGNYSITIPQNSYKINGYTFKHWKDTRGNIYYPNEDLSVSVSNSPAFYDLYAVWEKGISGKADIGEKKEKSSNNGIVILVISISVIVIISISASFIYMFRKKIKNRT